MVVDNVLTREEFRRVMRRERAACDRNNHEFSLLVFDGEVIADPASAQALVRAMTHRIREIDEVGWLDSQRLGLLLPYTSFSGATTLARDLCRIAAPLQANYAIYTYPGRWLKDDTSGSASAGDESSRSAKSGESTDRLPVWKRTIDIVGSFIGLVCLSPLFLLVAALIKVVSPGPVFLRQKRVGHHGKVFTIWKFRTMRPGADNGPHQNHLSSLITSDQPMTKLDAGRDPRIFPLGNLIRRTYVDELPQLINVLRGEMSLVGPRPCIPYEAQDYKLWQTRRFDAVPGMTGLWQVSGKNRTTFKEMVRLDIAYSRRRSFWLDISVLLKTVPAILSEIVVRRAEKAAVAAAYNRRRGAGL